jgi:exonuclease III
MLRVLAYNVNSASPVQAEALAAVLQALNADVAALTETDHEPTIRSLADRLGYHCVWERGSGTRHIATLSRYPIRSHQIYNRRPLTQAVLETTLEIGVHSLRLFNLHFLPFLLLPFEIRRWQAAGRLLAIIRRQADGPHLILGDLNAIGPGDRVLQRDNPARMRRVMALQLYVIFRLAVPRLLRAGYTDCYRRLHPRDDGFTWWTRRPTTRYDYILADPRLASALRTCDVVTHLPGLAATSDHFPLLASFDLSQLMPVDPAP